MATGEAIIKYSQIIQDDGAFDKAIQDFDKVSTFIKKRAKELQDGLQLVDKNDLTQVNAYTQKIKELEKANKDLQKAQKSTQSTRKKTADLTRDEIKSIEEQRKARADQRKEIRQQLRLEKAQSGSIEELRAKLAIVTREWANLTQGQRENTARGERLIRVKKELTEQLKREEKATGDTRRNVGNYAEAVKEAIRELREEEKALASSNTELREQIKLTQKGSAEWLQYSKQLDKVEKRQREVNEELGKTPIKTPQSGGLGLGQIGGAQGLDIGGISGGANTQFINQLGQGLGKISTSLGPIGVGLGGLAIAGGALTTKLVEIEKQFNSLANTVQKVTGLQDQAVNEIVVNVSALSNVYEAEQNELIRATNVLIKEFNLSAEEANKILEAGFQSGANAQGDLLDSISEYSVQLKASGGDAEDLIAILDASGKQGIFSDKGVDVVKEFGLRIREQTKATQDALKGAFGDQFANELLAGVRDGSITSLEALQRVSQEIGNIDDVAKQQTLIADVFGGAGEDAGLEFIKTLGTIEGGIDDIVDSNNPLIQQEQRKIELEKELAKAQQDIAEQALGAGATLDELILKVQIFFTQALGNIVSFFNEWKEGGNAIINFVLAPLELVGDLLSSFGKLISGDFSGAFEELGSGVFDLFNNLTGGIFKTADATEQLTKAERQRQKIVDAGTKLASTVIKNSKEELTLLNNRLTALEDNNLSEEDRKKVMDEVLKTARKYNVELETEDGNLKNVSEARKLLNKAIIDEALQRAKASRIALLQQKIIDRTIEAETERLSGDRTFFDEVIDEDAIANFKFELENINEIFKNAEQTLEALGATEFFDGNQAQQYGDILDNVSDKAKALQVDLAGLQVKRKQAFESGDSELVDQLDAQIESTRASLEGELKANGILYEDYIKLLGILDQQGADNTIDTAQKTGKKLVDIRKNVLKRIAQLRDASAKSIIQGAIAQNAREQELLNQQIEKLGQNVSDKQFREREDQIEEEFFLRRQLADENAQEEIERVEAQINEQLKKVKKGGETEKLLLEQLELEKKNILRNAQEEKEELDFQELEKLKQLNDIKLELERQLIQDRERLNQARDEDVLIDLEDQEIKTQQAFDDAQTIAQAQELNSQLENILTDRFIIEKDALIRTFDLLKAEAIARGASADEIEAIEKEKNNALKQLKNEYNRDLDKLGQDLIQKENEIGEKQKEQAKKILQELGQLFEQVLDELINRAQQLVEEANKRVDDQQGVIDRQRQLAQDGAENSLAFEKEQLQKREAQLLEEQKRLERLEKIKALYASYQAYASSGDPQSALVNTIRDFAILEGIAGTFGDGGLVADVLGDKGYDFKHMPSDGIFRGVSHNHASGGIPILVEGNEGIFSQEEMGNLGRSNFYAIKEMAGRGVLEDNFWDKQRNDFGPPVMMINGIGELTSEMREVKYEIKKIPRDFQMTDWEKHGDFLKSMMSYRSGNKTVRKEIKIKRL